MDLKSSSDLAKLWIELQENVNCLLDSSKSSTLRHSILFVAVFTMYDFITHIYFQTFL